MAQLAEFVGNHVLLVAGLAHRSGRRDVLRAQVAQPRGTHVTAADAVRLINKGALVIDVRKPEEYEKGHIVNARNCRILIGAGLVTSSCDQTAHRLRPDVDIIEGVPASVTLRMGNTHFLGGTPSPEAALP